MPTASLEAMLELWSTSLREAKQRIRPLFTAPSVARSAHAFLDGLLGAERRKTGWMRAEAAGDPGPWRQQAVLGRSQWNADSLRDVVREHVVETLAEPDAGSGRGAVLGDRGGVRDGQDRAGSGPQRDPLLAWLALARQLGDAGLARVRQRANGPPPKTERRVKLTRALVAPGDPAGRHPARPAAH